MRMTIKDIARLSGYGIGTVSRVLNNHPDVSEKARKKILSVIEENNFQSIENYFYPTKQTVDNIAKDRPHWSEMTKEQYYASVGPNGAMFVGDPAHVAQKIIRIIEDLQLDRFMLHLPIGSMPHEDVLKAIKLYGEEVASIVRRYFENKG